MRGLSMPVAALLATFIVTGCGDGAAPTAPEPPSSGKNKVSFLTIVDSVPAEIGSPVPIPFEARDRWGRAISPEQIDWATKDADVAVVNDGVLHALTPGSTTVTATVDGVSAQVSVKSVGTVTVESVRLSPDTLQVAAGKASLVTVYVQYSNGSTFSFRPHANWATLDAGVASVTKGRVTGESVGATKIVASFAGHTDTSEVLVTEAAAPGADVSGSAIAVQLVRFDGGSGPVLVSSGVPLAQGMLYPGQSGRIRLFIEGTEHAIATTELAGRHVDGSLRSVLVQARLSLGAGERPSGYISLSDSRPESMDAEPAVPNSLPLAAVLPSSPDYLVATDLVGPTVTTAQVNAMGGVYARYESDFAKYADQHWAASGDAWTENYYDRAQIYFAFWVRTANPDYWNRGAHLAASYRRDYLEANNYGSSPHWAQMEGLATHYWLTGDEASRKAVGSVGGSFFAIFQERGYLDASSNGTESRIVARVLQAQLLAWRLQAKDRSGASPDWGSRIDAALAKIPLLQDPDGGFRYPMICGGTLNYMDGMLADVLIEVHRNYRADPVIRPLLERLADYKWTQWMAESQSFKYTSIKCDGVGSPTPSPDLNNLQVNLYAWLYDQTGDDAYRQKADAIFAGGVTKAYLTGTKQFNESYNTSYRYLSYRQ